MLQNLEYERDEDKRCGTYQEITPIAPRSIEINNRDREPASYMIHILSPDANKKEERDTY